MALSSPYRLYERLNEQKVKSGLAYNGRGCATKIIRQWSTHSSVQDADNRKRPDHTAFGALAAKVVGEGHGGTVE